MTEEELKFSRMDRSFILNFFCYKTAIFKVLHIICHATAKAKFGCLCPALQEVKIREITSILGHCKSRECGSQKCDPQWNMQQRQINPFCWVCQFVLPDFRKPIYFWEHRQEVQTKNLGHLLTLWSSSILHSARRGEIKQPQPAVAIKLHSGMVGSWEETWRRNKGKVSRLHLAEKFCFLQAEKYIWFWLAWFTAASVPFLLHFSLRICASTVLSFYDTGCHINIRFLIYIPLSEKGKIMQEAHLLDLVALL